MMPIIGERLLLTLWIGSLWTVGYLVVPMAFVSLGDVTLAAAFAGKLFRVVMFLGVACAAILLITQGLAQGRQLFHSWRGWLILLMLLLMLAFIWVTQVQIVELKQLGWQENSALAEVFTFWHMVSRGIYGILSLLGFVLVVSMDKPDGKK